MPFLFILFKSEVSLNSTITVSSRISTVDQVLRQILNILRLEWPVWMGLWILKGRLRLDERSRLKHQQGIMINVRTVRIPVNNKANKVLLLVCTCQYYQLVLQWSKLCSLTICVILTYTRISWSVEALMAPYMALSHNICVGYPLDPQPHQSQFAHIIFKLK